MSAFKKARERGRVCVCVCGLLCVCGLPADECGHIKKA